jgi:hypothetical protein
MLFAVICTQAILIARIAPQGLNDSALAAATAVKATAVVPIDPSSCPAVPAAVPGSSSTPSRPPAGGSGTILDKSTIHKHADYYSKISAKLEQSKCKCVLSEVVIEDLLGNTGDRMPVLLLLLLSLQAQLQHLLLPHHHHPSQAIQPCWFSTCRLHRCQHAA